jgi:hypothetical protein
MLKYIKAHVRISELHTQPVTVPAWELPILQIVHSGEGDVTVVGENLVDRLPPEANDEFTRLANRYGNTRTEDGSIGVPYVVSVYGQFGIGNAALAKAIAAATVIEEMPAQPVDGAGDLIGNEPVSSVGG